MRRRSLKFFEEAVTTTTFTRGFFIFWWGYGREASNFVHTASLAEIIIKNSKKKKK